MLCSICASLEMLHLDEFEHFLGNLELVAQEE
jgi:hypothetical protein